MIIGCMYGCGKKQRTCPMCQQKYNVDEGVEYGPYVICPNCDRDNQFLLEFGNTLQGE